MYIPSLDMGEYDEYSRPSRSRSDQLPPVGGESRGMDRQQTRSKMENLPRLPRLVGNRIDVINKRILSVGILLLTIMLTPWKLSSKRRQC